MVDELKQELRKLENIIGCEEKLNVTSKAFYDELIRALLSKYESDLDDTLRLHRLELFYDLIEAARRKQRKSVEVEEKFVLSDDKVEEEEDEEDDEILVEKDIEEQIKHEDVVSVRPEDVDDWKVLKTLSKIYYVLEHPNSEGLTWGRRVKKKKIIRKFGDKDLIEWRVAQQFRLKSLEEWAVSRMEERKMSDKSPYDFDDLLEDKESRELEDMFQILETQKQRKPKITKLAKILRRERPFKFKDESMDDWTESYSEDSEKSGADEMDEDAIEIWEEEDFKVGETVETRKEPDYDEESSISEIFSSFEEFKPYKDPKFDEIKSDTSIETTYDICFDALYGSEPREDILDEIGKLDSDYLQTSDIIGQRERDRISKSLEDKATQQSTERIAAEQDKIASTEMVHGKIVETGQDTEAVSVLGKNINKKSMDLLTAAQLSKIEKAPEMTKLEELIEEIRTDDTIQADSEEPVDELAQELILKGRESFIRGEKTMENLEEDNEKINQKSDASKETMDIKEASKEAPEEYMKENVEEGTIEKDIDDKIVETEQKSDVNKQNLDFKASNKEVPKEQVREERESKEEQQEKNITY